MPKCETVRVVQPFTSDDTYICPDCGSEVRVGARSCPGCGPFQPMKWSPEDNPTAYTQSAATLADRREAIRSPQTHARRTRIEPPLPEPPAQPVRFPVRFLVLLAGLTLLASAMLLARLFAR